MRIDSLYENFVSLNNTHQGGFFRPVADYIPALKTISLEVFNTLVRLQTKSQQVQDALLPFKKTANITVEKTGNQYTAKYPKDYKAYESGGIIVLDEENKKTGCDKEAPLWKDNKCILPKDIAEDFLPSNEDYVRIPLCLVSANKWNGVLSHPNRKPTFNNPFTVQRSEGFEVAPNDIGIIVVDYYRLPAEPVYAYQTIATDPDLIVQFVESGSTHLEWGDEMIPAFLYKLSQRYGYTVSDQLKLQVTGIDKSLL